MIYKAFLCVENNFYLQQKGLPFYLRRPELDILASIQSFIPFKLTVIFIAVLTYIVKSYNITFFTCMRISANITY